MLRSVSPRLSSQSSLRLMGDYLAFPVRSTIQLSVAYWSYSRLNRNIPRKAPTAKAAANSTFRFLRILDIYVGITPNVSVYKAFATKNGDKGQSKR